VKIAYVITRAEMGGAQVHVLDLLKGFHKRHTPILLTGEDGYLTEECARLEIEHHVIPDLVQPLRPWQDLKAIVRSARWIRSMKPDLVHCHTSKAGIIGRLAARIWQIPAIFTAHTWCFAEGTSALWRVVGKPSERLSANWSQRIIAVSESNRKLAIEKGVVPAKKIVTIHNGIRDTLLRAAPSIEQTPEIVMIARFAPQKNQLELVEALGPLNLPYRLTFVGDGPTRSSVEACVASHGLQDKIRFLGLRSDTDEILSRAHIFVLATKWEGFPLTILEAMRAGVPVIATDVDGVREAVTDGENGLLYPREQVNSLREALRSLLTNPQKRGALGSAGRRRYEANFTHEIMLQKTAQVYEEVFARSGTPDPVFA